MKPEEQVPIKEAVICFLRKDNKVLLAWKEWRENRKNIGVNRWNGPGGMIEEGESPEETVVREMGEECLVKVLVEDLEKIAIVDFYNTLENGSAVLIRVHMFTSSHWEGEPQVVDEMVNPTWFDIDKLPVEDMMLADRVWAPIALSGKKIIAEAHYGPFQKELLGEVTWIEVDEFDEVD